MSLASPKCINFIDAINCGEGVTGMFSFAYIWMFIFGVMDELQLYKCIQLKKFLLASISKPS